MSKLCIIPVGNRVLNSDVLVEADLCYSIRDARSIVRLAEFGPGVVFNVKDNSSHLFWRRFLSVKLEPMDIQNGFVSTDASQRKPAKFAASLS